jgi:hypothetical protein
MTRANVSQYFRSMQRNLFPDIAQELGEPTDKHLQAIVAFDMECGALGPYTNKLPDRLILIENFRSISQ